MTSDSRYSPRRPFNIVLYAVITTLCIAADTGANPEEAFPRLMGMNISNKNYGDPAYQADIARLDIAILGFYPGFRSSGKDFLDVVREIKARNPRILIGQYTSLDEAYNNLDRNLADKDIYLKLHGEKWWLRNEAGEMVQWTNAFNSWSVNITDWTRPDKNGRRYPQWLAERNYAIYFRHASQLDIWYVDNVNYRPRVTADWNHDGENDSPHDPVIGAALRRGHRDYWGAIRQVAPSIRIIGNADNDLDYLEFRGELDGAFLEALMGERWSIETRLGWDEMMKRYRAAMRNTRPPHLVGFNVHGRLDDYRLMRYGLASCLMDDGYFSYTNADGSYSGVIWFDEFDAKLGKAIDPPQESMWQQGVFRRRFEHGMALANPSSRQVRVSVEPGYRRLMGHQDAASNNGMPAREISLGPMDGLVLIREEGVPSAKEPHHHR